MRWEKKMLDQRRDVARDDAIAICSDFQGYLEERWSYTIIIYKTSARIARDLTCQRGPIARVFTNNTHGIRVFLSFIIITV